MSDNIVNFPNDEHEEEHDCLTCQLVDEFLTYVIYHKDDEDVLRDILTDLVQEAKLLEFKENLVAEINRNVSILKQLECSCDICNEENCDLDK
jgi:hypothetical protein